MYRKVALQFVSVLLTVMVTAIGMCFAAEKKKAVKQEQVQTKRMTVKELKEEYATKPFDAKVATLPPGYLGHDIVALYERLSKAFPPKDEFESTEAYQKRLQGGYPQGNLAFLVENRFAMISASYDPDVQNMLIKINADRAMNLDGFTERLRKTRKSSNYDPLSGYETVIKVKHITGALKQYEASNKMGAKTVVTEHTGQEYGVGLANKDSFAAPEKYSIRRNRNINIKISPEEARDLKGNLGILLICRVRPCGDPPTHSFKSFYHAKPTMDSPTELSYSQFFVNVDLFEIWVFNRMTGNIYAKEVVLSLPEDQESGERST